MNQQDLRQASPSAPTALHVDQAMLDLGDAIAANADVVRALLRRIDPLLAKPAIITGTINACGFGGAQVAAVLSLSPGKAPLAAAIEDRGASIAALTKEVIEALDALQV